MKSIKPGSFLGTKDVVLGKTHKDHGIHILVEKTKESHTRICQMSDGVTCREEQASERKRVSRGAAAQSSEGGPLTRDRHGESRRRQEGRRGAPGRRSPAVGGLRSVLVACWRKGSEATGRSVVREGRAGGEVGDPHRWPCGPLQGLCPSSQGEVEAPGEFRAKM